jgi:hypothetical protein
MSAYAQTTHKPAFPPRSYISRSSTRYTSNSRTAQASNVNTTCLHDTTAEGGGGAGAAGEDLLSFSVEACDTLDSKLAWRQALEKLSRIPIQRLLKRTTSDLLDFDQDEDYLELPKLAHMQAPTQASTVLSEASAMASLLDDNFASENCTPSKLSSPHISGVASRSRSPSTAVECTSTPRDTEKKRLTLPHEADKKLIDLDYNILSPSLAPTLTTSKYSLELNTLGANPDWKQWADKSSKVASLADFDWKALDKESNILSYHGSSDLMEFDSDEVTSPQPVVTVERATNGIKQPVSVYAASPRLKAAKEDKESTVTKQSTNDHSPQHFVTTQHDAAKTFIEARFEASSTSKALQPRSKDTIERSFASSTPAGTDGSTTPKQPHLINHYGLSSRQDVKDSTCQVGHHTASTGSVKALSTGASDSSPTSSNSSSGKRGDKLLEDPVVKKNFAWRWKHSSTLRSVLSNADYTGEVSI